MKLEGRTRTCPLAKSVECRAKAPSKPRQRRLCTVVSDAESVRTYLVYCKGRSERSVGSVLLGLWPACFATLFADLLGAFEKGLSSSPSPAGLQTDSSTIVLAPR